MLLNVLADGASVALICDLLFLNRNTGKIGRVTNEKVKEPGPRYSYMKTSHRFLIYSFVPYTALLVQLQLQRSYLQVCLALPPSAWLYFLCLADLVYALPSEYPVGITRYVYLTAIQIACF